MEPIEGQPILTAAQMRAAEERAAPTPEAMYALMEWAGRGVAEAVRRLAAGAETLVLCGPGNNGGDGYVAARVLRDAGHPVRVAAIAEPATDLARRARAGWTGPVEAFPTLSAGGTAPVLVDALFGTGLSRSVDGRVVKALARRVEDARLSIAVDLPTGVDADTGRALAPGSVPTFDLCLALGAPKPAHVLMPAAEWCGAVRLLDLGLIDRDVASPDDPQPDRVIGRATLHGPFAADHKYTRGLVVVIGGAMPGAAALAVTAAMRAGAGYGLLLSDTIAPGLPHAVVQRPWQPGAAAQALRGKRAAVIVIGPGLGRDAAARAKLDEALACPCPLIIDGDALHLLGERDIASARAPGQPVVLTPHAGEFAALFGEPTGSKIEAAREAAVRSGAIVAFKGADTVVAHPDGRIRALTGASPWLSTAGTGDVLAGTIAGLWQATFRPVEAGVWLHAEAARRCGGSFIADDLVRSLSRARAACR